MNHNTTVNKQTLPIPTRDEFHRFASNYLSKTDFDTQYAPGGTQINKVIAAMNWTLNNERWRSND